MIIKNAWVYTENFNFQKKDIYIHKDKISDNVLPDDDQMLDAEGLYAIPGLTDIHFHGCAGYDFCDGTIEAITAIAEYEATHGITSIAPATMTLGEEDLSRIFKTAADYAILKGENLEGSSSENVNPKTASLVGINMEGPYLSCAKKGAQNAAYLKSPDSDHFRRMQQLSGGLIKLVSIAPEENGAMEFIKEVKNEVMVSVAHTTADYNTASEAFQAGAGHVTHLYNAMPVFNHREPGVIGAAFDAEHAKVELICDGVHIAPSVIRATFRLFGDERIILISDSMMATGLNDGEYSLGGQKVFVKGNTATLTDGTIAGSATNLMDCLRTAVSFGIPLESAVKCAAVNPAKQIGSYGKYGSITPGKYADIILLKPDLSTHMIIKKGQRLKAT